MQQELHSILNYTTHIGWRIVVLFYKLILSWELLTSKSCAVILCICKKLMTESLENNFLRFSSMS